MQPTARGPLRERARRSPSAAEASEAVVVPAGQSGPRRGPSRSHRQRSWSRLTVPVSPRLVSQRQSGRTQRRCRPCLRPEGRRDGPAMLGCRAHRDRDSSTAPPLSMLRLAARLDSTGRDAAERLHAAVRTCAGGCCIRQDDAGTIVSPISCSVGWLTRSPDGEERIGRRCSTGCSNTCC